MPAVLGMIGIMSARHADFMDVKSIPAGQHALLSCRELGRIVDTFVLRRTSEVNQRYLPCLSTFVVFCKPSALQVMQSAKFTAFTFL